jgi:hypothetical protein
VVGTTAYITAFTRLVMDKDNGCPVVALNTRTDSVNKNVYLYASKDPKDKDAKKLRAGETMGPAYFAFGVPLRTLRLKIPVSRRVIIPLTRIPVQDQGHVYCGSFAEIEKEVRNIDMEAINAAKATKAAKTRATRSSKKQSATTAPNETTPTV